MRIPLAIPCHHMPLPGVSFPGRRDGHPLAIPWLSRGTGMSALGMTAIPSLCPLVQGMGLQGWHSSPASEPFFQGMGRVQMAAHSAMTLTTVDNADALRPAPRRGARSV